MCEVQKRTVAPSDKEESISVEMRVRDAVLTVEGNGQNTYSIRQHPETNFRDKTTVKMKSGSEYVTVVELESGSSRPITLKAGSTVGVSFRAP